MSAKPNLMHDTKHRKGVNDEHADKKTLFEVCFIGTLYCSLLGVICVSGVNVFTPADTSTASHLSSCFIWKDQGWLWSWLWITTKALRWFRQREKTRNATQVLDGQNMRAGTQNALRVWLTIGLLQKTHSWALTFHGCSTEYVYRF